MTKETTVERIGFRAVVARQPSSLEVTRLSVANALESIDIGGFRGKIVGFAGIGASYQAALAGAAFLRAKGSLSFAYCSSDLYGTLHRGAEAFVALSASGQSREIVEVMQARPGLPRIAIVAASTIRSHALRERPSPRIQGRTMARAQPVTAACC